MDSVKVKFTVFMPMGLTELDLEKKGVMRRFLGGLGTADRLLCNCGKCARPFLIWNKYNQVSRFFHIMTTVIGKGIKNDKIRSNFLIQFATLMSKEGIVRDMVRNYGFLSITCPQCMEKWFTDIHKSMNEMKKDVFPLDDNGDVLVTKEMIEKILRALGDIYTPLFVKYTTKDELEKELINE